MGKHNGKTPPGLQEELEKAFGDTLSNIGDTGFHVFVILPLLRLTEIVFVDNTVLVDCNKSKLFDMYVCRLKVISLYEDRVLCTVDFIEEELKAYNGLTVVFNLLSLIGNSKTGKLWVEEIDGRMISHPLLENKKEI